jgi:hypothetical protein
MYDRAMYSAPLRLELNRERWGQSQALARNGNKERTTYSENDQR